jgi:methyl-accepting chemotaxis protein
MYETRKNGAIIGTIERTTLPDALAFSQIQVDTLKIQQWMSFAAATGDPSGSEKAQENYELATKALNAVIKSHGAEGEAELRSKLLSLRTQLEDFMSLGMQMVEAYLGLGREVGNTLMDSFNPSADAIMEAMAALVAERNKGMKRDFADLLSSFSFSLFLSVGAVVVSALLSLFIALGLANSISKSIRSILGQATRMKEGDLTIKAEVSTNDELGVLAENLNGAVGGVKALVESVKTRAAMSAKEAKRLSAMADEVFTASSGISQGTEEMRKDFDGLVESISGSVSSIEKIFGNISELSDQVGSQASAVSQISASIEEISASLRNVERVIEGKKDLYNHLKSVTVTGGEKVEATNEYIADISKNAEAIVELISMIKGVSSQTNLLAMNASIEAAHAGEFGKGFAVVADEIRNLAESTGAGAVEVSSSLEALVADIGAALESSRESGAAFGIIDGEVRQVIGAFEEISGNAAELTEGSAEITKAMTSLLSLTSAIEAGSTSMETETEAIDKSLKEIEKTSTRSRDKLREIDTRTIRIRAGISELSDIASQSRDGVELLNREIAAFKTEISESEP